MLSWEDFFMNTLRIRMPYKIGINKNTYIFFTTLYNKLKDFTGYKIYLDCKDLLNIIITIFIFPT